MNAPLVLPAAGPVSANDLLDPQAPPAAGKAHEDGPTKKARPGEQAEMLDTSPQTNPNQTRQG